MSYQVKEIYLTLQGEGAQTGRLAVFLRFAGCNLWTGREKDRASALCRFCDTDFIGTDGRHGGKYGDAEKLAETVNALWPEDQNHKLVVCTGGEPFLQLDSTLIKAMQARGFTVAAETNGTLPAPEGMDWICVSPKGQSPLAQTSGHELKLVYPQNEQEAQPENFAHLPFQHFFLQPLDQPDHFQASQNNLKACLDYCRTHPQWRLSLQTHKMIGID
jgi:7-carboxy-7-deazaguanine synthase